MKLPEQIIGSPDQKMLWVGNEGQIGVSGIVSANITGSITIGSVSANVESIYIQSGANLDLGSAWTTTGSVHVANIVPVSGVVTVGDIAGSVAITTSPLIVLGSTHSTGRDWSLSSATDSVATTITSANVFIASGADIGSVYIKDGATVAVTGITTAGSLALQAVDITSSITLPVSGEQFPGSVYQATVPWIVLGSMNVDNASSIGILGVQTVNGTVAISTDPVPVSGILTVEQSNSTRAVTQSTSPWITSGNVTITDDSFINVIPSGTFYSTMIVSGTHIPISGEVGVVFSNDYVNVIQSGTSWDVSGTANVLGSVAITNDVIQVSGDVTISNDSYINIAASGTTGIPISGETTTTQGTDPWIILGSAQITNDALQISGNVTVSDGVYIAGSVDVVNFADLGSTVVIDSPSTVGSLAVQTIDGTVAISTSPVPISGAYFPGSTFQATSPWTVFGSVMGKELAPTDSALQNFAIELIYSGTVIGSVIKHTSAGSYIQVLTYTGNNLTGVGSFV